MKTQKNYRWVQFLLYLQFFAVLAWFSLRDKAVGETVLYSVALTASIFLGVLELRGWGVKKQKQDIK